MKHLFYCPQCKEVKYLDVSTVTFCPKCGTALSMFYEQTSTSGLNPFSSDTQFFSSETRKGNYDNLENCEVVEQ